MSWIDQYNSMVDTGVIERPKVPQPAQQPHKKGGRGGFLTSLISEGAGAGGAAGGAALGATIGSVVPGVGTVIGGLAGAALGGLAGGFGGSAVEQKVRDDKVDWGKAAAEGLISGATSAVPGVGRLAAGGVKNLATKGAEKLASRGAAAAESTVMSTPKTGNGLISKFKRGVQDASSKGFGVEVGASAGRGQVVTPDDAAALNDFITKGAQKYGGIRAGNPIEQARDAQNVFNNVKASLDTTLNAIDRPLQASEPQIVLANITDKITASPAITKGTPTAEKFATKIQNAKSIKELEAIRREADDLAYTATGAGKTSAAAQARAVREAIDDFITPMSPEYKAIKGDYQLAKDALNSTSKASKNAKGIPVPFTNGTVTVGDQAVQGVKNKAASLVTGGKNRTLLDKLTSVKRQGAKQAAVSGVMNASEIAAQPQEDQQPAITDESATLDMMQMPALQPASETYPRENMLADIRRDPTNAKEYMALYEMLAAGQEKSLSAEASRVVSNAQTGLQALDDFDTAVGNDPNVLAKRVVPGRGLFGGALGGALGTTSADAAATQIIDVIARLRTGAAITKDEATRFERMIPVAADPPETRAQKINYLRNQFAMVAQRSGSAGTDLQQAAGV